MPLSQCGGPGNGELEHVVDVQAALAVITIARETDGPGRVAGDTNGDRLGHHFIRLCGTDKSTGGHEGRRAEKQLLHAILPIDSRTRHAVPQSVLLPVPSAPTLAAPYSICCGYASVDAD